MKRKSVIALVLAAGLSLSLFGCGSKTADPTGAPASQPPANTEQNGQPSLQDAKISIVSAASGGAWYSIGGALAELFKNEIPGA